MLSPTVLKWGVGVVGALLIIGFVLSQANALMKKGVALGKAESRIEALEKALEDERAECQGHVTSLNGIIENCSTDLAEASRLSDIYRGELAAVAPLEPPEPVVIEIESTTVIDALAEGHLKALQKMEVFR